MKEKIYYIQGLHCASCELIIEKKILDVYVGVRVTDASYSKGSIVLECINDCPTINDLNQLFKNEGYAFSQKPVVKQPIDYSKFILIILTVLAATAILYSIIQKVGFIDIMQVDQSSSLVVFLLLGLIAGVSSCAALVGGIVLSMSKRWADLCAHSNSFWVKAQPHVMFNIGRLVSYLIFGAILGYIGGLFALEISIYAWIVLIVSLIMLLLGLQMIGFEWFKKWQLTMPKQVSRWLAMNNQVQTKYTPFLLGAGTFFLPCGFTLTVQSIALISGDPITSMFIMGAFALGTIPSLLVIGLASVKLLTQSKYSNLFVKIAGFTVVLFALYTANAQLNVLGIPSFSDIAVNMKSAQESQIQNDKQVINMDAGVYGYEPGYFKVKTGIPVVWNVTNAGASGCTNRIIAPELFIGEIDVSRSKEAAVEFVPTSPGIYKFSCWMGMAGGVIEVTN